MNEALDSRVAVLIFELNLGYSLFLNKVFMEHSHPRLLYIIYDCFPLKLQSRVIVTETIWSAKLKICTILSITIKVCQSPL